MLSIIAIIDFLSIIFLPPEVASDHIVQGCVIFAIVFVNVLLSTLQETKADKALDALEKTSSPTAKVLRDGKMCTVLSRDLVIGDLVFLEDGMIVPADLRLIETNSLKIDESALTGESLAAEKDCYAIIKPNASVGDKINCAFASTIVSYGSGLGVVSSIGMKTEVGKIAKLLSNDDKKVDLPPLKRKINKLTKTLT
jgi:Ca2+-transporting ATPase